MMDLVGTAYEQEMMEGGKKRRGRDKGGMMYCPETYVIIDFLFFI